MHLIGNLYTKPLRSPARFQIGIFQKVTIGDLSKRFIRNQPINFIISGIEGKTTIFQRVRMKDLSKRFINIHSGLGPLATVEASKGVLVEQHNQHVQQVDILISSYPHILTYTGGI